MGPVFWSLVRLGEGKWGADLSRNKEMWERPLDRGGNNVPVGAGGNVGKSWIVEETEDQTMRWRWSASQPWGRTLAICAGRPAGRKAEVK